MEFIVLLIIQYWRQMLLVLALVLVWNWLSSLWGM